MKHGLNILIALSLILVVTGGAFWLDEHPGNVELTWLGYRIAAPASIMVGGLVVLALAVVLLTMMLASVTGVFRAYGLRRHLNRQEEGMEAATRAMVLLATGDHKNASKYVDRSARKLGSAPLVPMLRASIARREGDQKKLTAHLERMLAAPSTQPLAAMALAADAKATGELEKAAAYIEQAGHQGTMERGTALVLLDIYHRQKRWPEAEALLRRMQRKQALGKTEALRYQAILHFLQAREAAESVSAEMLYLKNAFKCSPSFIPAAALLARRSMGKPRRALATIRRAWRRCPHPELVKAFFLLMQNAAPRELTLSANSVAKKSPGTMESLLLQAETAARVKDWEQAHQFLKAALAIEPQSRVYHQLAVLEQECGNLHEGMGHWLALAAGGKPSPAWACTHCGVMHQEWHAVCGQCDHFATIDWNPPLQQTQRSLRDRELLTAAIG